MENAHKYKVTANQDICSEERRMGFINKKKNTTTKLKSCKEILNLSITKTHFHQNNGATDLSITVIESTNYNYWTFISTNIPIKPATTG